MFQSRPEQIFDVIVFERVKNLLARAVKGDDVMLSKNLELMGDTALRKREDFGDIVDTQLMTQKKCDDGEACRISENGIEGSQRLHGFFGKGRFFDGFDMTCLVHIFDYTLSLSPS